MRESPSAHCSLSGARPGQLSRHVTTLWPNQVNNVTSRRGAAGLRPRHCRRSSSEEGSYARNAVAPAMSPDGRGSADIMFARLFVTRSSIAFAPGVTRAVMSTSNGAQARRPATLRLTTNSTESAGSSARRMILWPRANSGYEYGLPIRRRAGVVGIALVGPRAIPQRVSGRLQGRAVVAKRKRSHQLRSCRRWDRAAGPTLPLDNHSNRIRPLARKRRHIKGLETDIDRPLAGRRYFRVIHKHPEPVAHSEPITLRERQQQALRRERGLKRCGVLEQLRGRSA